jgi:hypothetical protein
MGYSEDRKVTDIRIENMHINGKPVKSLEEAGIEVGPYAEGIILT